MSRRSPLHLAILLGLALLLSAKPCAASPSALLGSFFERANAILRAADPARGLEEPRRAIRQLVSEVFDFREAAEIALGPVWRSRSPREQEEFIRLFADLLERGYIAAFSSKASLAGGVMVEYLDESVAGESATVPTRVLTRAGEALPVDYRLVRQGDRWTVRDVVVDGVSLVANYRAQFTRILHTSSFPDLLARMRGSAPKTPLALASAGVGAAVTPALAPGLAPAATEAGPRAPGTAGSTGAASPPPALLAVSGPATPAPPGAAAPPGTPAPSSAATPSSPERQSSVLVRPDASSTPRADKVPALSPSSPGDTRAVGPSRRAETRPPSAPKPTPTPGPLVPASVPAAGSRVAYWVQIGAFKTAEAARHLSATLRPLVASLATGPARASRDGAPTMLTRVRLGPFVDPAQATARLRELEARGYSGFIARIPD